MEKGEKDYIGIRQQFKDEIGGLIFINGSFNWQYVKWLEDKVIDAEITESKKIILCEKKL